ncbi:MAG: 30S ribosomal protein S17 [Kiritimatiellae bacterium]|nr:30S ribosomal protein S17 [Kiritimatiellia bacterium]MDD4736303.1 30S ribosomal protein S17 [Kiritimatiellia bacterium]
MNETRGLRKEREGVVVSSTMDKTIVVKVSSRYRHRLYGKEMKRSAKFYAHDEQNDAKVGDEVRIMETRPISRTKCWRLVEVTKRAN